MEECKRSFYSDSQARQAVAEVGRQLLMRGLVARTWGNVSCRTGERTFVITPSGLGYEGMTAADIVSYDLLNGSWTGTRKPSSEKGVHIAAYQRYPDAGFVIHTHQTFASALGLAGFMQWKRSEEDEAFLGGVALAQYGLPGTKRLMRAVERAMAHGAHTILMAHHGALIIGRDREEAFERAERLELLCEAACQGQPLGEAVGVDALAALALQAEQRIGSVAYCADPAVIACARAGMPVYAQLDDMAQMIGRKLICVAPNADAVASALQKRDAVLVRDLGAVCRAETKGDRIALRLLTKKACVCWLHTGACGEEARLSALDTALMRYTYQTKYARRIGG